MGSDRILSDDHAGVTPEVGLRRRAHQQLLATLLIIGLVAAGAAAEAATVFGSEPGGRTIGGPAQTSVKHGSSRELLTFLHRGPTPFRFICLTGLNEGPGILTVLFSSRIGETTTTRLSPGEARVVCGETTGVAVECHGQGGECSFRWRIDEPK